MKHQILGLAAIVLATTFSAPNLARASPTGYVPPSSAKTISCNIGESCIEKQERRSRNELRYAGQSDDFISFAFLEHRDQSTVTFNIYYPVNTREFTFGGHLYRIMDVNPNKVDLQEY